MEMLLQHLCHQDGIKIQIISAIVRLHPINGAPHGTGIDDGCCPLIEPVSGAQTVIAVLRLPASDRLPTLKAGRPFHLRKLFRTDTAAALLTLYQNRVA